MRDKPLTAKQMKAARLVGEDALTIDRIAEECGVNPKTIWDWKKRDDFMQVVRETVQKLDEEVSQLRFAKRRNRVALLNKQLEDYETIVDERSAHYLSDPATMDVPGVKTGRVVRQIKVIGVGKNSQVVDEYVVDTGLEKQIQSVLEHIAKERGEWSEKRELSGPNGTPLLPIIEIRITEPPKPVDDDND